MESHSEAGVETFSTQDLDLAAFLSLSGFPMDFTRDGESSGGHPIGSWVFSDYDGDVRVAVEKFKTGQALVDPHKYYAEIGNTRNALFKFLGIPLKRKS
jgi:hypothetical protein